MEYLRIYALFVTFADSGLIIAGFWRSYRKCESAKSAKWRKRAVFRVQNGPKTGKKCQKNQRASLKTSVGLTSATFLLFFAILTKSGVFMRKVRFLPQLWQA